MAAVNSEVTAGINTYVLYGKQTSFDTDVTPNTIFGGLVTNASFETDRQYNERAGFVGTNDYDGRATSQQLAGTVVVNASVDFDVQRWDWLEHLMLKARTGNGTTETPYIYTIGNTPTFLTLTEEIDNVATDSQRAYGGIVINSVNIKCSVGEPVSASVTLLGGRLSVGTTITAKIAQLADDVYNFSGGTISVGGTPISNIIDSIALDYSNNYTLAYGFNEEAKNARPGKINIGFKFTTKYFDDTLMTQFLGSATTVSAQTPVDIILKFTKGTNKYAEFTFKNVVINRQGTTHSLNEFLVEDTDTLAQRLEVKEVI